MSALMGSPEAPGRWPWRRSVPELPSFGKASGTAFSLTLSGAFALMESFAQDDEDDAMKRTYQPSKTRRARTHGFLVRMKTRGGQAVINARRAKGRKRLSV